MNIYWAFLLFGTLFIHSKGHHPGGGVANKKLLNYLIKGANWNWQHKKTYAVVKSGAGFIDVNVVSKYRLDGRSRAQNTKSRKGTTRPRVTPKVLPRIQPKVTSKGGTNLALGKKATVSSQYGRFGANLAVNGKITDFFHTKNDNMAWFRVDLGGSYNVQKVVMFNRKDCCGNRLRNVQISVGETLGSLKTCGWFKGPGRTGQRIEIKCGSGIKGRFVQIQMRSRGFLHLAEVQVFGDSSKAANKAIGGGTNLALGKKATASSQYGRFGANLAVNGKITDFFHTRYDKMPWFRVDLGGSYNVQKVVMFNRKDCCGNRLRNVQISVGETLGSLKTCGWFKGPGRTGQRIEIKCGSGIKGRFVQIQMRSRGFLHLAEVQVFGDSSKAANKAIGGGTNLALGKKATASSQYGRFGANLAVNGKITDFFHTRYDKMPWFRVDLGGSYNVQKVVMFNRKDCCGNRLRNVQISVGETLGSLKTCGWFKGPGRTGQRIEIKCGSGIKGRFVQIQMRSRGFLHLAEVQVFGDSSKAANKAIGGGTNLALGKKATASSQYGRFGANLAVNGKITDFFHTRYDKMPWFRVDLGGSYNVQKVVMFNRKDCCGNRLRNVQISVGETLGSLKTCGWFKGPGRTGQRIEIKCGSGIKGRFVQIQMRSRGFLHLAEVQVFGDSSKAANKAIGGGTNLALGKKATVSSQYGRFGANLAVNGKITDFFHTRYDKMPWFRVDLGGSYNVQKVVMFNRKDCCGNRLRNVQISVGETLGSLKTCGWFKGPGRTGQRIEIKCGSGIKGRFVQIQMRSRGFLHLAEVQVFGDSSKAANKAIGGGTNLALGKKATASSQYGRFGANLAVNGKITDFFHTRYDKMPWFRVDLGGSYNVQKVVMFNRKDCCGNRLRNVQISVGETLGSLKTCGWFKGPGRTGQRIEIKCGSGIKGRFVQIQMRSRGFLHLAEVQVFGDSSKAANKAIGGGTNLALGKKATASSQYGRFGANLAVNGKITDFFHTRYDKMPWFRVDLGGSYNVQKVVMFNRKDCCGNRLRNVQISVGETLGSLKTCGWFKGPGRTGQRIEIKCGSGIKGRFVQIQMRSRGFLHLAEVQVFGDSSKAANKAIGGGTNLALGKKATASSQYGRFGANLAVNGKITDFFHTRYDKMPWFRVDLGGNYNVQKVVMFNRKDCCGNRLRNVQISVGETLGSLKTCGWFKGPGRTGQRIEIKCGSGIKGRFVQIQMRSRGFLHLAEVQVY